MQIMSKQILFKKMKYKHLELLVYDFDGAMTNNKLYIDKFGNEIV